MKEGKYTFTKDWFSNNIPRWEEHFAGLKGKPLKVLELGCFEGRSAIWMLENILTSSKAHITCVDNFSVDKTSKRLFKANTKSFENKVTLIEADTRTALKSSDMQKMRFDIIYVDAGRSAKNVLEDAILSFPMLKTGGFIVFDDYTNSRSHDYSCPRKGIDAFLDTYNDELNVRNSSWQVIAMKVKTSGYVKSCKSELD